MRAESVPALSTLACNCSSSASLHTAEGESGSDIIRGGCNPSTLCGNHIYPLSDVGSSEEPRHCGQSLPGSQQLLMLLYLAALGFDLLAEGSYILLQLLYEAITLLQLI